MEIVNKYLTFADKKTLVDTIVQSSIIEEEGMKYVDYISMTIAKDMTLLMAYFDLDIDNVDLDDLYQTGEIEEYKSQIPQSELDYIDKTIEFTLEQRVSVYNSLVGVLNRNLGAFIKKLPSAQQQHNLLNKMPEVFDEIDPDKLSKLHEMVTEEHNNESGVNTSKNKKNTNKKVLNKK